MEELKKFMTNYWGAVIGGLIALVIACTGFYKVIVCIVLIGMVIWAGNYFQHNKDKIKAKVKSFIDKI